jgi:DNA-binding IclR family transcriptional regulator
MWKILPHSGITMSPNLESDMELTLAILKCYLKHGPSLSLRHLSAEAKISEDKTKCILSILEKRGYLRKLEDTGEYVLGEKIVMLV